MLANHCFWLGVSGVPHSSTRCIRVLSPVRSIASTIPALMTHDAAQTARTELSPASPHPRLPEIALQRYGNAAHEPAFSVRCDRGDAEQHRPRHRLAVRAGLHRLSPLEPDPDPLPTASRVGGHRGRAGPGAVDRHRQGTAQRFGDHVPAARRVGAERAGAGAGHAAGSHRHSGAVAAWPAVCAGRGLFPPHRRDALRAGA